ncbi:pyridoxamine 5'-phosphate oxidase family protein [Streptomyces kaempferi]|uniref:Pyridoxamine 5'-phosphate oxidase family protein n=1 Tax=Streptomyces kaempferi TaxID=333725 RepID=A0ABW3XX73_9ACTN
MNRSRSHLVSYHDGELAAQDLAGFRENADRMRPIIGDSLPRGVEGFLADLRFLVVGATSPDGQVWASLLFGEPGFLHVLDARNLSIGARPSDADPLARVLQESALVGTLAIDLANRRRLRINGRMTPNRGGLRLSVDQAYGNCPKYIQRRSLQRTSPARAMRMVSEGSELTAEQRQVIDTADIFFIASTSAAGDADASHRGGNPGFVRSLSADRIQWPDYEGNTMLMTLGNLTANPAAGLVFIDWLLGTTVQLTGTATVDWSARTAAGSRAERTVAFRVTKVIQIDHSENVQGWSAPQYSRFNPPVTPPISDGP